MPRHGVIKYPTEGKGVRRQDVLSAYGSSEHMISVGVIPQGQLLVGDKRILVGEWGTDQTLTLMGENSFTYYIFGRVRWHQRYQNGRVHVICGTTPGAGEFYLGLIQLGVHRFATPRYRKTLSVLAGEIVVNGEIQRRNDTPVVIEAGHSVKLVAEHPAAFVYYLGKADEK